MTRKTSDERLVKLLDDQDHKQEQLEAHLRRLLATAGRIGSLRRKLRNLRRRIQAREKELRSDRAKRANETRRRIEDADPSSLII